MENPVNGFDFSEYFIFRDYKSRVTKLVDISSQMYCKNDAIYREAQDGYAHL